jgi:hypothetical protein
MMRKPTLVFCLAFTLMGAGRLDKVVDPSERVAIALFEGSHARLKRRVDSKRLRHAVAELARLGARPADAQEADVLPAWRAESGSTPAGPVYRGRILGPAYRSGLVAPGMPVATEQLFLAGQLASLSVVPSQGAKLGLTVTNGAGIAICNVAVREPTATCRWTPVYADRVKISIQNLGPAKVKYFLVVN